MAKDTCWQLLLQALQHVLLPWFPTKVDARRAGVQSSTIVVDRQVHQLFQAAEQSADQTIVLKGPNSCQVCNTCQSILLCMCKPVNQCSNWAAQASQCACSRSVGQTLGH